MSTTRSAGATAGDQPRRNGWVWIITGMAFLLGALLGGGTAVAVRDRSRLPGDETARPAPASASATAPALAPECRQALDRAIAALSTAQAAGDALRHLQTARLQRLLDDLEKTRREVDTLSDRCRQRTPGR